MVYNFTNKASGSVKFIKLQGPFSIFKEIRDGDISLEMKKKKKIKKILKGS